MFSCVMPEQRVPQEHPLREIRNLTDGRGFEVVECICSCGLEEGSNPTPFVNSVSGKIHYNGNSGSQDLDDERLHDRATAGGPLQVIFETSNSVAKL
jgi:hypothetical protein